MKIKVKSQDKKSKFVKNIKNKSDEELLDFISEYIKNNSVEKYLVELTKTITSRSN